jgi:hypothetical protein
MEVALEIELYDKIRGSLSDEGAKELVRFIEKKVDNGFENKKDVLATKQDIAELRVEIAKSESRIIKWMFIFWIGQIATVIAIMKLL